MKAAKLLQMFAWMTVWMLLALPVAFADNLLTVQKFSGRDNVPNFAKEDDELTVQVLAQMLGNPTPEVAKQRARISNGGTYVFMDSCVAQANNIEQCTYKTSDLVYAGTDDYSVALFDAENNKIAEQNKTLTVDFLAPKVVAFAVSPNMTGAPVPTTVTYAVEDYGRETGKLTDCSGIKLINITANSVQVASVSANLTQCSKQGSIVFTPSQSAARVTVCMVATDYLNHQSLPTCKDIIIDSRKPVAQTLELRDSDGFVLSHVRSSQPIVADVAVRIPDVDVLPSSVTADLSKLNPALGKKPATSQSGEWFLWRAVTVTTPNTCQVTVDARDLIGNTASTPLTCTVGIDDTAPVATGISTQFVDDDNTPLLGKNGTIRAAFTESGSGFDKRNAFLDLHTLGLGNTAQASQCDKIDASTWTCSWNVRPAVQSGDYKIKLLPVTRDDVNNQIGTALEQTVRYDNTAPSGVRLREIDAFRPNREKTNTTALGETLEFIIEGKGFTNATADFSDLGGGRAVPDSCTGNSSFRTCTFSFTTAISGPQPVNITFVASDIAGNTATFGTGALFVLGISNETAPNYWNITAQCSPTLLDRSTLSIFEHPVYCRIAMRSPNRRAIPVSVEGPADPSAECTGDTQYLSSISVENNYAGSTEPYIVLSLIATDYAVNNLSITCPLSTLTRVGNFRPQNAEQDNATIRLQFYNMPLGELYHNLDDEVSGVKASISGVWSVIGTLQKFFGYAEKFCQILNIIITIISTIATILVIIAGVNVAAEAIDFGIGNGIASALRTTQEAMCNPTEALRNVFNKDAGWLTTFKKFCDFITCQAGLLDALGATGIMSDSTVSDIKGGVQGADTAWLSGGNAGAQQQLQGALATNGNIMQNPSSYLNVKDSLIYSIVIPPLCIPGIIYNLDKWRQIQCQYGDCLLNDVRNNGLPVSVCKDQKHYAECRYVLGEIFNIIPFAPLVNYYLNMFQQAVSDPLVLASMGIAFLLDCKTTCKVGDTTGFAYIACAGMGIASQLGYTIKQIKAISDTKNLFSTSVGTQWCNKFEDDLKEYEASQNP